MKEVRHGPRFSCAHILGGESVPDGTAPALVRSGIAVLWEAWGRSPGPSRTRLAEEGGKSALASVYPVRQSARGIVAVTRGTFPTTRVVWPLPVKSSARVTWPGPK